MAGAAIVAHARADDGHDAPAAPNMPAATVRQSGFASGATAAGAVVITGVEGCAGWTAAGIPNAPIAPESAAVSIRITDARRLGCACASMVRRLSGHRVSAPLSGC